MSDTYKRAASEDYVARAITAHANNTNIHVSVEEKATWNAKYAKDANGIPKTDMSSEVQTSLGKADTALQPVSSATNGNFAALDGNGKVTDSGKKASDFAVASATYTKTEVDAIVAALKNGSRVVVESLPETGEAMKIYMVPKSSAGTSNAYDEYIWTVAGAWEKIGDTEIDLSGYVQKEAGKGLSTEDYTTAEKTKLGSVASDAQVNVIETVKVNDVALVPTNKAVNIDITGKANTSDLPYSLETITPTQGTPFWTFSGSPDLPSDVAAALTVDWFEDESESNGGRWLFLLDGGLIGDTDDYSADATTVVCQIDTDARTETWAGTAYAGTVTAVKITPLVYALANRQCNIVQVPANATAITFAFPEATPGKMRDFLLLITLAAGAEPEIAFPDDATFNNAAGEMPDIARDASAAKTTLLMLSEIDPGDADANPAVPAKFLVKGEEMVEIAGATIPAQGGGE